MTDSRGRQQPVPQRAPQRRGGLSLGSWVGVPVRLDVTWLVLAAYITISFVSAQGEQHTATERYAAGVATSFLLAASVLLHELGHAVTAQALGLRVRRITLYLLGGVSEIDGEARTPAAEYLVALAGPLVSVLLATCGGLASALTPDGLILDVLVFVTVMNGLLAVFNLLPGLPLDGGRLVRAAMWHFRGDAVGATRAAALTGRGLGALLVAAPIALLVAGRPLGVDAFVSVVVGLYIALAAGQALTRSKIQQALPSVTARRYGRPLVFLPVSSPVSELVRHAQRQEAAAVALVDSSGRVVALVDEEQVRAMPEQRRPWVTADQVSQRLERWHLIPDTLAGGELLEKLRATGAALYLIMEDGDPRALLDAREVGAAVQHAAR